MDHALDHFAHVSNFGRSPALLVLILAADLAFTALHSWQEWKGAGGPLWRNFGAIVGLKIPDRAGFLAFTVGLTLALWALGLAGIAGWLPLAGAVSEGCAAFALGAIIGARLSDTLVSHVLPYLVGYRPNPGLASTPFYVVEALFMIVAFHPGLQAEPAAAWSGIVLGAAAFVAVLPGLWLLRWLFPACRREPWRPGEPMPS